MNDEEYEIFLTSYCHAKEEEQRSAIEANASVIRDFKAYAITKGVALFNESFSYTRITGLIASAPGITLNLLKGIETERDGLFAVQTLSKKFNSIPSQAGLLRNDRFVLLAQTPMRVSPRFRHSLLNIDGYPAM